MSERRLVTLDGNEAAASVAFRTSEVIAIYPITPSSNMGEFSDDWAALGQKNIWGTVPDVNEMQSEGGAAGAVHGALQAGALTSTFTASQGLLLMIPNMYKIAGELTSFAMHVAARTVAANALSIFGDHSDVMACRQIGFALLSSGSVQEAHDLAAIATMATLRSRIPFLHFFDGFRTSHEVAKIEELSDDDLRALIDDDLVLAHRKRAMTPDAPVIRGTAQNPDVFFQAREACNQFYAACPGLVQLEMDRFAKRTGRQYHLFDYVGHPEAERVVVIMGSGGATVHDTVDALAAKGEKVGALKVRLYRPFDVDAFVSALPKSVKAIAVLDRTKEPGSIGDPLYLDAIAALRETKENGVSAFKADPKVIGGRYGLSSKEFTPAMVKGVFDELAKAKPKNHFTIGIMDDVTHHSLPYDPEFDIEPKEVVRALFWGLGADGTVGANKNSIKIIGEETNNFAQGYFVYDSKKSGAVTVSHLRFGPKPIRSAYLVSRANFVACHQFEFLFKYEMAEFAVPGGVFLLNSPFDKDQVWDELPCEVQEQIVEKKLRFYVIDALKVAQATGMGGRINTIMQTCFFAISGVLPREEAIEHIKHSIDKTYGKKGAEVARRNREAVDRTLENLFEVKVPAAAGATAKRPPIVSGDAPDFVQKVTALMASGKGDLLPVSAFPPDGTWPTATARWEKRNIAVEIPVWDEKICIQCNKCALVCPHAAVRVKVYDPGLLGKAPQTFKAVDFKASDFKGQKYTVQVAPEDCTGCTLCVMVCPAKDKGNPKHKSLDMAPQRPIRETERENYAFFLDLPEVDRTKVKTNDVKGAQFLEPLFEYSGACTGCGETPYIKLLTQLYGDRTLIANATGCSSIYGANLPTTPYAVNRDGRGPAWSNSLFEDNAEFGFGMRLAIDSHVREAAELARKLSGSLGEELVAALVGADQSTEGAIAEQRRRVELLRQKLAEVSGASGDDAKRLLSVADYFVRKNVWIVGGDGWAYDIGYGGLDHVLSMNRDVNILVLDTEVYSNTGGQQSKATPLGAAAKFAAAGKSTAKKDLGLMAMSYGHVYVARIAFGAKDAQTVRAFIEAESYPGPSLLIAYSHCIAHGYDMAYGLEQQKLVVGSGIWPLYRFDPRRVEAGQPPLTLDSGAPTNSVADYQKGETRFRMVEKQDPVRFKHLQEAARKGALQQVAVYQQLSALTVPLVAPEAAKPASTLPATDKAN